MTGNSFKAIGFVTAAQIHKYQEKKRLESIHGKKEDLKVYALRSLKGPGKKSVKIINLQKRFV